MRISTDRQRCIGAGMCALTAPEVFDQDDQGRVVLLDPTPATQQEDAAQRAADTCPSAAIALLHRPR